VLLVHRLMGAPQQEPHHEYFTEDVTGDTFQCDTAVYTVTSGSVRTVVHEEASASSNEDFTVTITPQNVVTVDEAGTSTRSRVWFGGDDTTRGEQFTATQKLKIVSERGGTVDSVNLTAHVTAQPNTLSSRIFDFGTCAPPECRSRYGYLRRPTIRGGTQSCPL
jgi:hypothetical protein